MKLSTVGYALLLPTLFIYWDSSTLGSESSESVSTTDAVLTRGDGGCCNELQVWMVSSRCAPRCEGLEQGFHELSFLQYDACDHCFVASDLTSLLTVQANLPTLLFVHGNSLNHQEAVESCCSLYRRIKCCDGPKMLIFWSWPAETVHTRSLLRPIQLVRDNARVKYNYAERQGYYVARLTQLMSTQQPLTLGGHSFGGLVAISTLHLLAGGQLPGTCLPELESKQQPCDHLRAAIIAGALDYDAVYPGGRYDRALHCVGKFYTTFNHCDVILKRWPIHSCRGQEALGLVGLCPSRLGENASKIIQDHVTCDVRNSHYMAEHLACPRIVQAICSLSQPNFLLETTCE